MKTIMIRKVPDNVHRELKKLCADKEITINNFLIALVTKEVKKNSQDQQETQEVKAVEKKRMEEYKKI